MVIGWPQGLYLALTFLGIGISISRHGKAREGKHSLWTDTVSTGMVIGLLYWGGFFGAR